MIDTKHLKIHKGESPYECSPLFYIDMYKLKGNLVRFFRVCDSINIHVGFLEFNLNIFIEYNHKERERTEKEKQWEKEMREMVNTYKELDK